MHTDYYYGQCTRHITFRKVFGSVRKMSGQLSAIGVFFIILSVALYNWIPTVIAQWC